LIHTLLTAVGRQRLADLRLPITRPVLHELIKSLQHTTSSAFQRCLYSAMFLLAFYGFFHVGELAAKSMDSADSVLKCLVHNGQPQMIKIINTDRKPFEILIDREDTAIFSRQISGRIRTLHRLRSINLKPNFRGVYNFWSDTSRYKGQSFRIGAASLAADQGFSDAQIRTLSRWKSDAFKLYIRSERLQAN